MLIRFTVENFRSFNEEAVFSMIPGRSRQHANHIISNTESDIDALRVALLYGANASGKSNLVKAMDFAQNLIITGTRPKRIISVEPFRLQEGRALESSRFEFEFCIHKQTFAYGFELDRHRVLEEWLYLISSSQNESALFERKTDSKDKTQVTFAKNFANNSKETQFLDFVARATRPNQLLLTELIEQNAGGLFEIVDNWFRHTLIIIFPESHFQGIELGDYKGQNFSLALSAFLKAMNTGIDEIFLKPSDRSIINIRSEILDEISGKLDKGQLARFNDLDGQGYLIFRDNEGEEHISLLGTKRYINEIPVEFDMLEESDGTRRLLDLFPILHDSKNRIFVIDELERSLHPNLVRLFIENFLQSSNQNQLIVTTHESTLIDLDLLRRDEIWFVEKSQQGASNLYSLEEFKIRPDLDARKGYLQGRFGAIPLFGSSLLGTPAGG